jgi:hypothetical protein
MFINTAVIFPEGSVLKIRFRLNRTDVELETRAEVRYCLVEAHVAVGMTVELEIRLPMNQASNAPVLIRATSLVVRSKPTLGDTTFPFEIAAEIQRLHSSRPPQVSAA